MLARAVDLSGTPWARIALSEREDTWCLVDAVDLPWIAGHRWNRGWWPKTPHKFYAKRNIGPDRATIYLHREVLIRADYRPFHEICALLGDHINGQSLDNRRANLRWATPKENNANRIPRDRVPSLDRIVARLLATHDREEIPW